MFDYSKRLDMAIPFGIITVIGLESWAKDKDWHMQIRRVETELVYDNKAA
jgi:hypothetical protein